MSLKEDLKPLTNTDIDNIIRDIDTVNGKGKDVLYLSFLAPWLLLTIWKMLAYVEILPGFQIELPVLLLFLVIFLLLVLAYLFIALPFYLLGLFLLWKPIRRILPSLPFYGCFTSKGCNRLKEQIHDINYQRNVP